jgi:uncharacterized membrane protein YbhN (UPF0104 family)
MFAQVNGLTPNMRLKKDRIWQILKITISLALISVVISQVSLKSLLLLWQRIAFPSFLLSILAFYVAVWSMARRYWILIGKRIPFHELFKIVLYQNIVGNLVTTAAGAAWYVGILSNEHKVEVAQCFLSLFLARFGDLLTLLVTLSFATLVVWQQIPTLHVVVTVVIFFLMAVVLLCLLILVLRRQLVEIASRILDKCHLHKKAVVRRIFAALTAFPNQKIDQSRLSIGPLTGYSVLTLGMMMLFAYSSLQIFGVRIGIWTVIFVVSLTQVLTLVPVQVLGGLGLYDVTYLYLYGLFGVDSSEFATVVLGLRLCFYLTNLALLPVVVKQPSFSTGVIARLMLKKEIT